MLSARGPWEPIQLQQYHPDHQQEHGQSHPDGGSHNEDDVKPQAAELLENGQPKPIVVLIDFPQMVSTQHPNAKELYERDTACLYKFFTHKLQFQIPNSERDRLHLTWESVQKEVEAARKKQQQNEPIPILEIVEDEDDAGVDSATKHDDMESVCLASKAQLRLDQELKASGYSEDDANRDSELYYYYNSRSSKSDEESEEDEDGDEDNDSNGDHDEKSKDNDMESMAEQSRSGFSLRSGVTNSSRLLMNTPVANLTREQLHEQAKERVRQQLEAQKKKGRQRGAFRKRNSNKSYLKGKRVYENTEIV
jgi:RIO kinase 2